MVDLPQLRLYWFSELFKLDVAIGKKIEDQNNLEDCSHDLELTTRDKKIANRYLDVKSESVKTSGQIGQLKTFGGQTLLNKGRQDGARLLSSTTGNEAASSVIAQNYGGLEKIHPLLLVCQIIHPPSFTAYIANQNQSSTARKTHKISVAPPHPP